MRYANNGDGAKDDDTASMHSSKVSGSTFEYLSTPTKSIRSEAIQDQKNKHSSKHS